MKKSTIILLMSITIILVCVGCQNKEADEPSVGITFFRYDDLFMSTMREAMELYEDENFLLDMNNSNNDQDIQNEQVDRLISKGVAVLAINLVDVNGADEILKKSQKADIPIVFFNREPDSSVIAAYEQCYYVGTDSTQAGILQGEMIVDGWLQHDEWDKNDDGIIQYVMLKGEAEHIDTILRSTYVIETIESHQLQTELLAEAYCNWDSQQGKVMTDTFIESYGHGIELVISNNDAMALGAIVALQNEGYLTKDQFIPIYGVDGVNEFLYKINSGLAMGTVVNDAQKQSQAIMDIAFSYIEPDSKTGEFAWEVDSNRIIRIPYLPVTIENIKTYIDEE